jgi:hypothetical protein
MNWKSGLFRVWLVISVCWMIFAALVTYFDVVVPNLQQTACSAKTCADMRLAHPELGNYFDCFDPPLRKNVFDDIVRPWDGPVYGWFGDRLPACEWFDAAPFVPGYQWQQIARHIAFAVVPPLVVMVFGLTGIWIIAGFRRTSG